MEDAKICTDNLSESEDYQRGIRHLFIEKITRPIWIYGIELHGRVCKSNTVIVRTSQAKIPRRMTDAPCYVSNKTLHDDSDTQFIRRTIGERSNSHYIKLDLRSNLLGSSGSEETGS